MAAIIQPLASTLRVLEWDDLPASVRTISDNFNPLADGILMLHQRQVAALKASIIAIPKGRRTGITFGTMLDKTLVAAARSLQAVTTSTTSATPRKRAWRRSATAPSSPA